MAVHQATSDHSPMLLTTLVVTDSSQLTYCKSLGRAYYQPLYCRLPVVFHSWTITLCHHTSLHHLRGVHSVKSNLSYLFFMSFVDTVPV